MITLETNRATVLDANARAFLMTFIDHVTTVVRDGGSDAAIVSRVHLLLFAALTGGDGAADAWQRLYRTVAEILENPHAVRNVPPAYAYLRSFVRENRDLADR
jgi:hypothetical protein